MHSLNELSYLDGVVLFDLKRDLNLPTAFFVRVRDNLILLWLEQVFLGVKEELVDDLPPRN